jgi:hypothetical protein
MNTVSRTFFNLSDSRDTHLHVIRIEVAYLFVNLLLLLNKNPNDSFKNGRN